MEDQHLSEPVKKWTPLPPTDRRVLGVLIEKAKTTPDAYPLTLNALRSGCNQKSNRDPVMNLDEDEVEDSLERLRAAGAIVEVQAESGRVPRYRHHGYEWFGVEKDEMAVLAELLLRGAQTQGELRGRAARMEPIPDLGALRPLLASLQEKKLVLPLTPPGRGQVFTHAIYPPSELEKLKARHGTTDAAEAGQPAAAAAPENPAPSPGEAAPSLEEELRELRTATEDLRDVVSKLQYRVEQVENDIRRLWDDLAG